MIRKPLISIIIPVYNVEPYLTEALDSVISQTYEKLEILVIDDGSSDRSGIICDQYADKDKRIRVVHQENRGLSAARNAGLDRMTGEACAFLDPDDAYEDSFIERLLAVMLSEEADLVVCKYTIHQTVSKLSRGRGQAMPLGGQGNYDRVQGLRALADGSINVSVWNKLYRSGLWRKIRYPEGFVYEDIDTTFRIFNICHLIHVLDEPLYLHRKRRGSITQTPSMKNLRDRRLACSHFDSFIELNTPEVFTPSHIRKWRQSSLNDMIVCYIYASGSGNDDIAFKEELREHILSTGKETGIENFGIKTRVAWSMLRSAPWLLRITYSVYHPIRILMLKVIGLQTGRDAAAAK